jgi:prevent-host-death family protein
MREIGVRELKASLSEVLRGVERGEQVRVTLRGRAVADLVPTDVPRRDERMRALVAEGRITPAARPRPRRAPRLAVTARSASAIVLADRTDER